MLHSILSTICSMIAFYFFGICIFNTSYICFTMIHFQIMGLFFFQHLARITLATNKTSSSLPQHVLVYEHVLVYLQGCMLQSDLAIRCAVLCGLVFAFLDISSEHLNRTGTPVITWRHFLDSDNKKNIDCFTLTENFWMVCSLATECPRALPSACETSVLYIIAFLHQSVKESVYLQRVKGPGRNQIVAEHQV